MKVRRFFSDSDLPCLTLLTLLLRRHLPKRKKNREIKSIEIPLNLSHPLSFLVYCHVSDVFQLPINDNFGHRKTSLQNSVTLFLLGRFLTVSTLSSSSSSPSLASFSLSTSGSGIAD